MAEDSIRVRLRCRPAVGVAAVRIASAAGAEIAMMSADCGDPLHHLHRYPAREGDGASASRHSLRREGAGKLVERIVAAIKARFFLNGFLPRPGDSPEKTILTALLGLPRREHEASSA